ncbi:hypothetical protein B296_00053540 [Ensete ventricosum]|uniref:Uncharacterized protein n=1 Tax=Ensete ventricosum TaxID=4639 RepID=A0A426X0A7_ENSVE|nr:hypothetical protein B296_00053540 [Ensete ventricosum]
MIEPIEEYEEDDLEPEEENTKEDPEPADCMTHTLTGHVNPQAIKVEESLKQQSIIILIKTRSPNGLMNGKVKQVTLHRKCGSEEKTQRFEKDKLFLKCHIKLNQLWLLMQHSQILGYFHYFSQEKTMLFEVFHIDDRKKIMSLQHQYQHGIYDWIEIKILKEQKEGIHTSTIYGAFTTTMPSLSVLALPNRNEVFEIETNKIGVEIVTTLLQAGRRLSQQNRS